MNIGSIHKEKMLVILAKYERYPYVTNGKFFKETLILAEEKHNLVTTCNKWLYIDNPFASNIDHGLQKQ